jgi:hypothetical protein
VDTTDGISKALGNYATGAVPRRITHAGSSEGPLELPFFAALAAHDIDSNKIRVPGRHADACPQNINEALHKSAVRCEDSVRIAG